MAEQSPPDDDLGEEMELQTFNEMAARPRDVSAFRPRDSPPDGFARPCDLSIDDIHPSDLLVGETVKPPEFPILGAERPRDLTLEEDTRPRDLHHFESPRELPLELTLEKYARPSDVRYEAVEPPECPVIKAQRPRDVTLARSTRPREIRYEEIQPRFADPLDEPVVYQDVRPHSYSEDLDSVSAHSLILSPGVEEPCIISEDGPLEQGKHPVEFDPAQEHPGIDAANKEAEALEVEEKLDKALREGDYDSIEEQVTPKTLTSCKTNALLKAFEVNKRLRDLVKSAVNPETDEIGTLSNSVDEFTSAFVNPLRSDSDTRNTFKSCLDAVVDKAIDAEQKKFVSHPVVYNLLNSRWYRSFTSVRKQPWTSASRWRYLFLSLWPVLDLFLFPVLFALFFIVHLIHQSLRRARETEICFVLTLAKDAGCSGEAFDLIKRTMSYIIRKYGYQSANYSVILREEENVTTDIKFDEVYSSGTSLLNRVEALKKSSSPPRLYEDLCAARDAFKSPSVRNNAKKILVVFTNDKLSMIVARDKDLNSLVNEIKDLGVQIIPVGIGEHAKLSELEQIASKSIPALHFGEYEAPKTLGVAIVQGVEGKNIFDLYLDYFTTPYFIFVRDSLSYLALLGLHFVICLSSPTVAFSRLEWVIFIFFLGRIAIEVDQFVNAKKAVRKAAKQRAYQRSSYVVCSPDGESQVVMTASEENVVLKKFTHYFSDRWNMLDFVILVIYVATFTLRMFTWATSTTVSNNRPLAVAGYFYGLIAMFLTLRVFGHVMECVRGMGAIQIALFFIIWDVLAIFWQFLATILAFSLAMTKIYVVEKSYASSGTSGGTLACSGEGVACWWVMAKHLAWSLLGIAELEPLNSVDHPSMTLSHLLYSLFLVMGVILLVNMMIALLSNTYQRVEDNSLREWSFKKAITIRSYSSYHPVPVPFNLVSIPAMAIWRLCQCCVSERNRFDHCLDENGRKAALDKLVEKLEKTYFATYGYSFPLTDERKMDQLLHETDGSRRMANQIVHRVFRQQGCKQETCISGASAWESLGIGIKGCLLTYEGPDFCDVCKDQDPKGIHGARYLMPFTRETPRIEVLIQESGERRILAVGAVFGSYSCHLMPGWGRGSVGYHVDDGKIFEPGYDELGREVEDAMAYRGDLIACEVDFDHETNKTFPVVFFLNGREVARASMKRKSGQSPPFPFIAMGYEGIRVLVKMCPRDSGMAQLSHAAPVQRLTRNAGIEQDLTSYVKQQYLTLKEGIDAMERERSAQAVEFQEKLDEQRKMLTEIRNLVMVLIREGKKKENAGDNDVLVSEEAIYSNTVMC